ncbi:MAG: hypothetical protein ACKO40_04270, partial [Planctomycetaceae bacterium]
MTQAWAFLGAAAIAVLSGVTGSFSAAGEPVAFTTVAASDYASFLVNWDEASAPVFVAAIRTPQEYAAAFHPAPVMGNRRPFAPADEFFADAMLLVVARVIDAPAAGEKPLAVESLVADGDDLVLRYRFTPPSSVATHTVKQTLVVRVPKRGGGRVRFVENGQPAG